jgi:hypothetical protein
LRWASPRGGHGAPAAQERREPVGFVAYNLGIALLEEGTPRCDPPARRAGQLAASDDAALAIRDKSNLVLGALLFEAARFDQAKASLDRVRLEGRSRTSAAARRLRGGFGQAVRAGARAVGRARRARADRPAVQEAMLALRPRTRA